MRCQAESAEPITWGGTLNPRVRACIGMARSPNATLSYTSTDSLSNDGGPGAEYADCADCGPRFPPLFAHVRRDVQLGFRRRLRRRRPRLGFRPARADGMWDHCGTGPSSHVVTKVAVVCT